MKFRVSITRKEGLSDPEGVATRRALVDLGYEGVGEVHFGRIINLCSLNGVNAHAYTTNYNVAKEALRTLTRSAWETTVTPP